MEVHRSAQEVYKKRVTAPHKDSVNTGLSYLKPSTWLKMFGHPRVKRDYTDEYQDTDSTTFQALLVTREITGLGRVRGLKPAMDSLNRIMLRVRNENPNLMSVISSGGMFNCRRIRGTNTPSNHAAGLAIDIKVGGMYDRPGDGMTYVALLELYKYFYAEGWFWGTEFSFEDSMHFEVANETLPKMFDEYLTEKATKHAEAHSRDKADAVKDADKAKLEKAAKPKEAKPKAKAKPPILKVSAATAALVGAVGDMSLKQLRLYLGEEKVSFNYRMKKPVLLERALAHAGSKK